MHCRLFTPGLVAVVAVATVAAAPKLPPPSRDKVDFRRDVYPILKRHCFACHKGETPSSGHRLDVRAELLGETNGKPLVKPNNSAESLLIHLVAGADPKKIMPARGERLTDAQIGILRAWIDQGLAWDEALLPPPEVKSAHWAFRAVHRPEVPVVKNKNWVRNPIDAFLAAAHEAKGLTPAPEASRRVLLRRLALDLTGLPPTAEEIEAFEADRSDGAYEKQVDRLLKSPAHGERWARHWLDLARWAESEGYESDHPRPFAWRYRDYVVRCFNEDRSYDRFLREQIAGDELLPYRDENLIATGFLASGRLSSNEEDRARQRNDVLVDIVNATGSTVLGLTLNCAQCHSHKFDPISARDYYRFQGFFVSGMPGNLALKDPQLWKKYEAVKPPEYDAARKLMQTLFDGAKARLVAEARSALTPAQRKILDTPPEKRSAAEEEIARQASLKLEISMARTESAIAPEDRVLYGELKKKIATLEKKMLEPPQTFGFYSPLSPTRIDVLPMKGFYPPPFDRQALVRTKPYLLMQGDVHRRGPEVDVGWPAVFGPTPRDKVAKAPRSVLVDWLVDSKNPLTARVWVNRIWQYHFGRGLVATPSDFGTHGAAPSHPELLDWLASELIRSGWSTRHIHRLIVTSAAYRQAATGRKENAKLDPDNRLCWHWTPRRLEVEAIRDSMLAVSGELDRRMSGPSDADEGASVRRTLYLFQKRQKTPEVQTLFDGPGAATESCPRRDASTVPLQALYLLNNDFAVKRAAALAVKVRATAGDDRGTQIVAAFRRVLGRNPEEDERKLTERFFAAVDDDEAALAQFCQSLLNLNEFVYLE
jgi:hypothetical protein